MLGNQGSWWGSLYDETAPFGEKRASIHRPRMMKCGDGHVCECQGSVTAFAEGRDLGLKDAVRGDDAVQRSVVHKVYFF